MTKFSANNDAAMQQLKTTSASADDRAFTVANTQAMVDKMELVSRALTSFLEAQVLSVKVQNGISAADVNRMVTAVDSLSKSQTSDIPTKLDQLIAVSAELAEVLKTPKSDDVSVKNFPVPTDYTQYFADLEQAVKALKLDPTISPKITVKPSDVKVVNDFQELVTKLDAVVTAVSGIPVYDDKNTIAILKTLLAAVKATPTVKGSGSGASQGPSFKNADGTQARASVISVSGVNAVPVVNPDGSLVGATSGSGGLTDAQLRATPVPVIGTVTTTPSGTQTVSGSVSVSNFPATQPVSGTFFQATQPVSASTLPLPTGASTASLQSTGNTSLGSIDTKLSGTLATSLASVPQATLPSIEVNGQTTGTTAGTAVQIASNALAVGVIVQALSSNATSIFVGTSSVSSSNGFELQPGQATSVGVSNTNAVWIVSTTNGDKVCWIGS